MKSEASSRILKRRYYVNPHSTSLAQLELQAQSGNRILDKQGWTGRRVMGYKLPVWQRPPDWSMEQSRQFIESIWLGVGLGTYMVNLSMRNKEADMVLLDGQQRLRAIEEYLAGRLEVHGDDGKLYRWTDLTETEQAHFHRIPFPWNLTEYSEDEELRDAYNRHNFGGTPHTPQQRA